MEQVFEEYQQFVEKFGDLSVIPTRYFLGRPDVGEEMHVSIEQGKTLIIRLMAVGPVVEGRAQRDVWFEVNGEVRPPELLIGNLRIHPVTLGPCCVCRGQELGGRDGVAREGNQRPRFSWRAHVRCRC